MVNLRHAVAHVRHGDWDAAHSLAQKEDSPLGAWLHGILHLVQGDLDNAEYWYQRAGRDFNLRGSPDEEIEKLEAELPN